MKPSTEFVIRNARVTRVNVREKVTYVSLATSGYKAGTTDYWDVTAFNQSGLTFVEGSSISVKGSLSRRKPAEGAKNWTTELIAREVQSGDENLTVAMPVPRSGGTRATGSQADTSAEDDIPF